MLDGIYTALLDKFAYFPDAWRTERDIPWYWQVAAIHNWVRNSRNEMARQLGLQDELGGHKWRYLEAREKVRDEDSSRTGKRKKAAARLIDVKTVVMLYRRVERTPGGDVDCEGDAMITIQIDPLESKIIVPTFKILADFDEAEGAVGTRYFDNGDVKPDVLDYDELVEECQRLSDIGKGSILAYSIESKVSKIRNNSTLAKAVKSLRRDDETADLFELVLVDG